MRVDLRLVIRLSLAAVLLAVVSHTRADPDLWGHVRFGGDILSSGRLPATDVYSFLSDKPWINHEWLAEVVMALAYAAGGGPGLAVLKALLVLAALGLVWVELGRQGLESDQRDLLLVLAVIGMFPQANHVRPQVWSLVAFAGLLVCLRRSDASARWLLVIPPLFAVWSNLHGGWIVGGGALAFWTAATFAVPARRPHAVLLLLTGVAAGIATLANPYGWRMWEFLATTVGLGRAEITDWQPVYRLGVGYVAIWALLAVSAAGGAVRLLRTGVKDPRLLGLVGLLAVASFRVSRLLAFFAIALVLCLGREIAAAVRGLRRAPANPGRMGPAAVAALVMAAVLVAGGGGAAVLNLACVRLTPDQPDPGVVPFVRAEHLRGRLAVWFDWGEYAIWHFAPDLQVSIDGRRETVYSDAVMQRHLDFYYRPDSRTAFLDATKADFVWLPASLPVVEPLIADGWEPVYRSLQSVWLSRGPAGRAGRERLPEGAVQENARRCFPGP